MFYILKDFINITRENINAREIEEGEFDLLRGTAYMLPPCNHFDAGILFVDKAEASYNTGEYEEALSYLNQAEACFKQAAESDDDRDPLIPTTLGAL